MNDLRLALRLLAKSRGFTAIAIVTLALGIGATTLTFSMVNAVLLRPFPALEPQRLVALFEVNARRAFSAGLAISYANFVDWRRDNQTLSDSALYQSAGYALNDNDNSEHVDGANTTAGFFEVFGIRPTLGRSFSAEEESSGGPRVVVLSHSLWTRRFSSDPGVLGRTIRLDAETYTVIGVMPPQFRFPDNAALWTPIRLAVTDELRGTRSFQGVGRLKPGVTLKQASLDLNLIADRLAAAHPTSNALYGVQLEPFIARVTAGYQQSVLTLFGAVACLLLITCVNVASLLLARGASREREIAVRLALGSTRSRIVRQLLSENLVLGLAGGALGLLLACWGLALLPSLLPPDVPYWMQFTVDQKVLAFAIGASVLSSLAFGMAPAWQLTRVSLNDTLKQGGRSGSVGRAGLMRTLVGVELVLALLLLTGAGLLVKSFLRLQSVNPGFDAAGVLTFRLTLPAINYGDDSRQREAGQRLVERLQSLPGVGSAALVSDLPLSNSEWGRSFTIAGRPPPTVGQAPIALNRVVSADYFRTMRIPQTSGRPFNEHDTVASTPVVIVDATFVRQVFPNENPIGQRVRYGVRPNNTNPWMEIIGVVADVRHNDLENSNPGPGIYVPLTQQAASYGAFYVMRSENHGGDVTQLSSAVRNAVAAFDPTLAPEAIRPMTELVRNATWRSRLIGGIFSTFAVLAVFLAGLGIYGVTAFTTNQRTREIGVRMALGAQPRDVLRLVLFGNTRVAAVALLVGVLCAFLLTRFLSSQLYAVNVHDPMVFVTVACVLALTATIAAWLPARRATKVDPIAALRAE